MTDRPPVAVATTSFTAKATESAEQLLDALGVVFDTFGVTPDDLIGFDLKVSVIARPGGYVWNKFLRESGQLEFVDDDGKVISDYVDDGLEALIDAQAEADRRHGE